MKGSTAIQQAKEALPLPPKETTALKPAPQDNLFDRMTGIYDSIARRAFEIFEGKGSIFGRDWDDWFQAEAELLHPVHIDVTDAGDSLKVRAEVPGFATENLDVSVEPERLTIAGKRETKDEREEKGKVVYSERCADEILRVIDLPAAVDMAKVTATLKDGVLHLEMPKAAPAKKIKVEPKAA
jgi:HSP20 family molecular chaperone IbpA